MFHNVLRQLNITNASRLQALTLQSNRARDWMPELFVAKIPLVGCNLQSEIYNLKSLAGS
jgi:hypothetical protein